MDRSLSDSRPSWAGAPAARRAGSARASGAQRRLGYEREDMYIPSFVFVGGGGPFRGGRKRPPAARRGEIDPLKIFEALLLTAWAQFPRRPRLPPRPPAPSRGPPPAGSSRGP